MFPHKNARSSKGGAPESGKCVVIDNESAALRCQWSGGNVIKLSIDMLPPSGGWTAIEYDQNFVDAESVRLGGLGTASQGGRPMSSSSG